MAAESLKEDDGATLVYAIGSFRFRRFGRETPLAESTANGYIQVAYQPFGLNSRRPLQRSPFVFLGKQKAQDPFGPGLQSFEPVCRSRANQLRLSRFRRICPDVFFVTC